MHFEYTQYIKGCLIIPILVSLFALSILVSAVSQFVTVINHKKIFSRDMINLLLAGLVCVFFLCMNVGRLLHGGIHLVYEREGNAIELQGEIAEIKELGRYSFPEIKTEYMCNTKNGVQFLINGVECTAVTRGTLEIGDYVEVIILPKSRYVLSIRTVQDTGQGTALYPDSKS